MTNAIRLSIYSLLIVCTGFLAGCVTYAKAKGSVIEATLLRPTEEIAILWDVGSFSNTRVQAVLLKDQTYSRRFEICMNAYLEKTFANNGYKAKAFKMQKAAFDEKNAEAKYVLVLNNTEAVYQLDNTNSVLLNVYGTLYEQRTGKKLWSVKNWLSSRADENGNSTVQLVRALASDGFLNIKLEEVVDSDGVLSPSYRKVSGCSF